MDFAGLAKPDDLILQILRDLFGPAAVLFVLYQFVKGWVDAARLGGRAAGLVGMAIRTLVAAGVSTGGGAAVAVVATGGLLVGWTVMADLLANYMGRVLVGDAFGGVPLHDPTFWQLLEWPVPSDPFSLYVFWMPVAVNVVSIIAAIRGRSARGLVLFLASWAILMFAVFCLGSVMLNVEAFINWRSGKGYLADIDSSGKLESPVIMVVWAAGIGAYLWGTLVVSRAPEWARDVWKAATTPTTS
ncbi:hypothetical protein GCM10027589_52170 [Actinocorallia lasiicapitis]